MADLINREALLAEYDRVHIGPPGGARKLMEDAPTIDAVQVVRCKDCKHFVAPQGVPCCDCFHGLGFPNESGNDFCSYGERRIDNEHPL